MKNISLILTLCLFSIILNAQEELELENVQVVKVFEAKLANAKLVKIDQTIPIIEKEKTSYKYKISKLPLVLEYPEPYIRPLAIKKEVMEDYMNGYLHIGAGLPKAIYAKAGYNYNYPELYDFNISMDYLSFNNSNKIADQNFFDLGVQLDGKYHIYEENTLFGKISFKRNTRHFYSSERSIVTQSKPQRKINSFEAQLGYGNHLLAKTDYKYLVSGAINYMSFIDERRNEFQIPIHFDFTYAFNKRFEFEFKSKADLNFQVNSPTSIAHAFSGRPSLKYNQTYYNASVGLDAIVDNNSNTLIFPYLDVNIQLLGSKLMFTGQIKSQYYANSLHNMVDYNQFINVTDHRLSGSFQKKFQIGLKGQISNVNYNMEGGYQLNSNKALFMVDYTANGVEFRTVSDSVNFSFFNGHIDVKLLDDLNIGTKISYRKYKLNHQISAWHLPNLTSEIYLSYRMLEERLQLKMSFIIENGRKRNNVYGEAYKLDPLYGLNFTADYNISRIFGAFLKVDNINNNKFNRWFGYEQFPINIIGGIKINFY